MKALYTLILILLAGTAYGQAGQWVQTTPSGCNAFTLRDGFIDIEWGGGCKDGLVHGPGTLKLYLSKNNLVKKIRNSCIKSRVFRKSLRTRKSKLKNTKQKVNTTEKSFV